MRLTQCKVKNKHVSGASFSPIMRHYFSDGRIVPDPLFLLLLSSLPIMHLTIKDHAVWNVISLSIGFFQKLAVPGCTKFSRKTVKTEMKANGQQLESK